MKVKNFFMMAVIGLMAVVSLSSCDDILGEWDRPAGSGAVAPQNPQTTTTITLNLDGNLFNNDKLYLLSGDAAINIATITEGAPVTITSSDENVITIDADGNVVPVGPGTATITIKVIESEKYTGATETITIVVGRKVSLADETGSEFVAQNGDQITGIAPNTMHLTIPDGALVRLKDATIKPTTGTATAAVVCAGDATLILEGTNVVHGMNNKAGIQVGPEGKTLAIDGTESIEAQSNNGDGAGIGSNADESCGNIVISNGKIIAYANNGTGMWANRGSAIGSGKNGSCQNIEIRGGTVNARAVMGCAIGSGRGIGDDSSASCQDILISGGIVTAETVIANDISDPGAAIGSAQNGTCGNITITDGTVTAISTMEAGERYCGAAGIGSGFGKSTCGNILITGGTIDSKCSNNGTGHSVGMYLYYGGAGIGTGDGGGNSWITKCGTITITGGNVKATGGLYSAGIGLGKAGLGMLVCGNISITGGIVNAVGGTSADAIGKGKETYCTIGTVTVDPSVTWNGTKGYTATATGYKRIL